jgi:hypothetical protein
MRSSALNIQSYILMRCLPLIPAKGMGMVPPHKAGVQSGARTEPMDSPTLEIR